VPAFLTERWDDLGLDRYGDSDRLVSVFITPREPTSTSIVLLLLDRHTGRPSLVAKLSRLAEPSPTLAAEAAMLQFLQSAGQEISGTVPRLVHFDRTGRRPLLIETALVGRHLDPHAIRRSPVHGVGDAIAWLDNLPRTRPEVGAAAAERLLNRPLDALRARLPPRSSGADLIDRTLELVRPLAEVSLPLVAEHGDLSHPNVLRLVDGRIAAVDWELGEPLGLPLHDAFFFLAYAAWARRGAKTVADQVAAFEDAFLEPGGWARPIALGCAERAGVQLSLIKPLFVACWARYAARLVERIAGGAARADEPSLAGIWQQRYVAYWHSAVFRSNDLSWSD
jgi:hypothetical protein